MSLLHDGFFSSPRISIHHRSSPALVVRPPTRQCVIASARWVSGTILATAGVWETAAVLSIYLILFNLASCCLSPWLEILLALLARDSPHAVVNLTQAPCRLLGIAVIIPSPALHSVQQLSASMLSFTRRPNTSSSTPPSELLAATGMFAFRVQEPWITVSIFRECWSPRISEFIEYV